MVNKNEVQENKWKESLKVEERKGQKLILKGACYDGIKGSITKDINYTIEHRTLVEKANLEIERHNQKMYSDSGDRELYR